MTRRQWLAASTSLLAGSAAPGLAPAEGELLYNGIRLPAKWPPRRDEFPADPVRPPYLSAPPPVIPISTGRQLFVDDFLIETSELKRAFHAAEYSSETPVIRPDRPWETQHEGSNAKLWGSGTGTTVFSDGAWFDPKDQLFKIWYRAGYTLHTCHAVSKDGIHWQKPAFDVLAGTNVVQAEGRGSCTVWLDHYEPDPSRRFKMSSSRSHMTPQRLYVSPDGIHWSSLVAQSIPCGDRTTFFYNPFRKTWVFSIRDATAKAERFRRYREHADLLSCIQWAPGEPVIWTGADSLDNPRADLKIKPQLYTLDAVAYESVILGLFSIWRGQPEFRSKPNELLVGFSRDGFHWDRSNRTAFIPVSEQYGDWNWTNVQSAGGCCLVVGDKLHFYVQGWAGVQGTSKPGVGTIGLATLRRDGFASMEAGTIEASLLTRKLSLQGKHLFVNADCRGGELRAEVVDEDGKILAGFERKNSAVLRGDGTRQRLDWRESQDLAKYAGRPVALRFYLKNAKLYSFWITHDSSGASNGYVAAGGPGFRGPVDAAS